MKNKPAQRKKPSGLFARSRRQDASATVLAAVLAGATTLHANPRTSANLQYSIATDTLGVGGGQSAGGPGSLYSTDASLGGVVGISTVASPAETLKHGYIGQLYEISGLLLSATPATLNEGGTRQLGGVQLLDDATTLAVNASSIAWSVVGGPLTSIDATGLATAGIVYQNTPATARGMFSGNSSTLALTVLNDATDNFGSYAGDGISDDWQVQYFGLPPNPAAAPLLDPDGDGQNNRLEWIAGLVPTDATSVFRLSIVRNAGNAILRFGPTVSGRTYTVRYGFDFLDVPNWPTLPGGMITSVESERFVTDSNAFAGSLRKYYRVEIAK